jgi:hypothetical protein
VTAADERTDELLRPFLDAIDADPSDPNPVAILADRLEEVGDERAAGLRWLVRMRKRPRPPLHYDGIVTGHGLTRRGLSWVWLDDRGRPGAESRYGLPWGLDRLTGLSKTAALAYLDAAAAVSAWLTGER